MPDELVVGAASVAVALLLAAMLWRWWARRRVRRGLDQMLVSPDPAIRRSALAAIGGHGLRGHAQVLLRRTMAESDPEVLDALAATVVRNQWEPADSRDLVALRLWAERRVEARRKSPGDEPGSIPRPEVVDVVESLLGEAVLELVLDAPDHTIRWTLDRAAAE